MQVGRDAAFVRSWLADPEVDESAAQVRLVDPARHSGVMRIGHEERQAESAQQALRRPFPVVFFIAYPKQFVDERDVRLRRQTQGPAQRGAHLDLSSRDVAAAGPQALDLRDERAMLLLAAPEIHFLLGQVVLQPFILRTQVFGQAREPLSLRDELLVVPGRALPDGPSQIAITPCPAFARIPVLLEPTDLRCQPLQPVSAFRRDRPFQRLRFPTLAVAPFLAAHHPRVLPSPVLTEPRETPVQQLHLESGEPGPKRLPARPQIHDFRVEFGMASAVRDERRQKLDLAFRLQHRLVGAVQIVEMADQGCDPVGHVERLQHVCAHELGQVSRL